MKANRLYVSGGITFVKDTTVTEIRFMQQQQKKISKAKITM